MAEYFGGPEWATVSAVFDKAFKDGHASSPPHYPPPIGWPFGMLPPPPPPPPPPFYEPPPPQFIPFRSSKSKKKRGKSMSCMAGPLPINPFSAPGIPTVPVMMPPGVPPSIPAPPGIDTFDINMSPSETSDSDSEDESTSEDEHKSDVKQLFASGQCICPSCVEWTEEPTEFVEKEDKKATRMKMMRGMYALIHRQVRYSASIGWQTRAVEINSPKLREFLSGVRGLDQASIGAFLTVHPPFSAYFHRRQKYEDCLLDEDDEETQNEAALLLTIFEKNWDPAIAALEICQTTKFMPWRFLWTLFPPGELVVVKVCGTVSVAKFSKFEAYNAGDAKGHDVWKFYVKMIDWDGSSFGYCRKRVTVKEYEGVRDVTSLGIYPLRCHDDPATLILELGDRGRKFESLCGYHFKAFGSDTETREGKLETIQDRVIVDAYAHYKLHNAIKPVLLSLDPDEEDDNASVMSDESYEDVEHDDPRAKNGFVVITEHKSRSRGQPPPPSMPPGMPPMPGTMLPGMAPPGQTVISLDPDLLERDESIKPLTDAQCLLTVPTVKGFSLSHKAWFDMEVTRIHDIKWDENAFKHLVMDDAQKRLILAFTQNYQSGGSDFDDFIKGKGRGMTFLLCGPPGVGKTLTAESLAEQIRAPLYTLSASELGSHSTSLENGLKSALKRCALWKAVLLIDEADVFMEERHVDSIERNSLVSVFLRLLEYYDGIMFLTTNRARALDPAFESRLDLIMPYTELDRASRRDIWANFIGRLEPHSHGITDADFDGLANVELNGREIKSTIKTALVLAKNEGGVLGREHVQTVLGLRQRAGKYLKE